MLCGSDTHFLTRYSLILLQLCSLTVACTAQQTTENKKVKIPNLRSLESKLAVHNPQDFGKNIIFYNSFEEGEFQFLGGGRPTDNKGPMWAQAQFQNPDYAAKFITQPKPRVGTKAMRFEWRSSGLAKSNTSKKAMIHYGKSALSETTDRWYGFSLYLPTAEMKPEIKTHVLIFQLHATPDFTLKEPWRVPPVSMTLRDNQLRIWHTYDHAQVSPKNDNIRPNGKSYEVCKQDVLWDRWTDFVLHVKFSLEKKGVVELWQDGKKVIDVKNIDLGYNDVVGPYPSWGLYSYKGPEKRVIYFDEITIGDQNASYTDVAPGRADGSQRPLQ